MNASENISVSQVEKKIAEQRAQEIRDELVITGVINILGVIPGFFVATIWWSVWWIIDFAAQESGWFWIIVRIITRIIGVIPFILIAAHGVYGVICSISNRKQKWAVLCLVLSIISLLVYVAMWCGLLYLGAHY